MAPGRGGAKNAVASDFNELINAGKTRGDAQRLHSIRSLILQQIVNVVRMKLWPKRFSARGAEPARLELA